MNLLEETLETLKDLKKEESDVIAVINQEKSFSWEQFKSIAGIEYSSGFGSQEINQWLQIVGNNWWLERNEYDGSEWWILKEYPIIPPIGNPTMKDIVVDTYRLKVLMTKSSNQI